MKYGYFSITHDQKVGAHVFALRLAQGEAPTDKPEACHRCDYPPCVNPDHLFWGSRADNQGDMAAKYRARQGDRHWHALLGEAEVEDIRRRHARGETIAGLAREFGVSREHIWRITTGKQRRAAAGPLIETAGRVKAGAEHPNAAFTVEQVVRIRGRVEAGEPQVDLALEFGVPTMTISRVVRRVTYKNVP